MDIGQFIVLTTNRYSPQVAETAVGCIEAVDVNETGGLTVRFTGDRVLNLLRDEYRPATGDEIKANDLDPDHDDYLNADEQRANEIYRVLKGLQRSFKVTGVEDVRAYISAAKLRARGTLSTDPESVKLMYQRIGRDHRGR